MPLVMSIGDLSASMEKPGMGRTMDSMIFLRSRYGRPVKGRESSRRISKNTSARCRVPPSEALDLKENCELGNTSKNPVVRLRFPPVPGTHIGGSLGILRTLCLEPTAVLSMRLRILQNSEERFSVVRDKKRTHDSPSILSVESEKATISASSITSFTTDGIPFLAVEGAAEPGRPKASNMTLGLVSFDRVFSMRSSLMNSTSVVRRFPLTLAKKFHLYGSPALINLDVDLGAFAIVLGFGPN